MTFLELLQWVLGIGLVAFGCVGLVTSIREERRTQQAHEVRMRASELRLQLQVRAEAERVVRSRYGLQAPPGRQLRVIDGGRR